MDRISPSRPSGLRSGCALPAPGRTRPDPAEALRRPESPDRLHTDGTTAVPGPDPRRPGAADHAFRPFPTLGLRPRCGNGRCCTSEWKWVSDRRPGSHGTAHSLVVIRVTSPFRRMKASQTCSTTSLTCSALPDTRLGRRRCFRRGNTVSTGSGSGL